MTNDKYHLNISKLKELNDQKTTLSKLMGCEYFILGFSSITEATLTNTIIRDQIRDVIYANDIKMLYGASLTGLGVVSILTIKGIVNKRKEMKLVNAKISCIHEGLQNLKENPTVLKK